MHVLVVSPIPSHPQFQGNSQRIFRLCRMLQVLGCKVHFLYYTLEGLDATQRAQMEACWDYVHAVPCRPLNRGMTMGDHYGLDDWYDPLVGEVAAALHARWRYQAVIVNYVWFSGVLESLPGDLVKIIDTHDVFGDRHLRSTAAGMKPEWYYTSRDEELRGLKRADLVLAIQDEEKAYFKSLGLPQVEVVGFVTPPNFLPPRQQRDGKITIGYIASSNPWNVNSFRALHAALEGQPILTERFTFRLAGAICKAVEAENKIFKVEGIVDSVHSFYCNVDAVVNPMQGGTGLKIKSIEALSYGRPFVSTVDGMVGIPSPYPQHNATSFELLTKRIGEIQDSQIGPLGLASREVFSAYQRQQMIAFRDMVQTIQKVPLGSIPKDTRA